MPDEPLTINYKRGFTLIELLVARHPKPWRRKAAFGFTLIELLVVIAIIGIMASLATYSYTDSQKKSRDSRRKSDLTAIQKALELAKQDSAGNYSYPFCYKATSTCKVTDSNPDSDGVANTTDVAEFNPKVSPTYTKAIPVDPKTGLGYTYVPLTSAPAACTATGACVTYTLITCLENSKDPQKDLTNTCTSPLVSYTITNL